MKKDLSENKNETKAQEQPIAAVKECCAKSAKERSGAVCPQEELSDNEMKKVAGGRSVIIHN